MPEPIVIATWPFGTAATDAAMKRLAAGDAALDAALAGAEAVENDLSIRNSVGFGSLPDRIGRLTLDACLMEGRTLSCGAVAGLEHIRHPAAVAKKVMEKTPHIFLVGEGAKWFALQNGFPLEFPYTAESIKEWIENHPAKKAKSEKPVKFEHPSDINIDENNHDTVTVLALDKKGSLGGVCTTSGLAHKLPGRVGDSPIIGAGTYADNRCCAVSATGHGEYFIRTAVAHDIYARMAYGGATLQAAADAVVMDRLAKMGGEGGIIAVGARGEVVMSFNSEGMFRGSRTSEGRREVAIYRDH